MVAYAPRGSVKAMVRAMRLGSKESFSGGEMENASAVAVMGRMAVPKAGRRRPGIRRSPGVSPS